MNKKIKISIITVVTTILVGWWAYLYFSKITETQSNYWWQAGLAIATILFAIFGLITAKKWSWLKSGVGRGIFFISLGLVTWGLGQAGWTYYVIAQPQIEVPTAPILDILYFGSIPLWTYGILQLSRATGARFGLRKITGKIFAISAFIIISALSYYFLVVVARGGSAYFDTSALPEGSLPFWWQAFVDLGYAAGDALNMILAITIFGLSWKFLGGKFKKPILGILLGFTVLYFADLFFSYYDGKDLYFNGHWVDLMYLIVVAIFGISLCLMDPSQAKEKLQQQNVQIPSVPVQPQPQQGIIMPSDQNGVQ